MKLVRSKFTKVQKAVPTLKRQAFLDALLDEAVEDPYNFRSFGEAIDSLSGKFKLSLDEIKYLKSAAKAQKVRFVEEQRNKTNS